MTVSVRGVVARGKGEPVQITEVLVPDPGPGEALVRVQACGVCHTDLHYKMGGVGGDFPYLLGHEAAGIVEAVGDSGVPSARVIFCVALNVAKQYQGRPRRHARHWPHTARQLRIT